MFVLGRSPHLIRTEGVVRDGPDDDDEEPIQLKNGRDERSENWPKKQTESYNEHAADGDDVSVECEQKRSKEARKGRGGWRAGGQASSRKDPGLPKFCREGSRNFSRFLGRASGATFGDLQETRPRSRGTCQAGRERGERAVVATHNCFDWRG